MVSPSFAHSRSTEIGALVRVLAMGWHNTEGWDLVGESALGVQLPRCAPLTAACVHTIETYHSVTRCEGSVGAK